MWYRSSLELKAHYRTAMQSLVMLSVMTAKCRTAADSKQRDSFPLLDAHITEVYFLFPYFLSRMSYKLSASFRVIDFRE